MLSDCDVRHRLKCKNLNLFSTLHGGYRLSNLLSPPQVAQLLKRINIEAVSGEVHGITGAQGSGKSSLLGAIACQGVGDVTGSVTLENHILTRRRFNQMASFLNPDMFILPHLTVSSSLTLTARLYLGGSTTLADIAHRVNKIMKEFEILQYANRRASQLSVSARRRLKIAIAIVKDPLLLVLDDVIQGLESLSSYHILRCLSNYAKRHNRIVLISLSYPRSDLYQLLDRISILFYGEVFYSGRTKDLPGFFRDAGYPCPSAENPAVYYLSLATIDRETSERMAETQELAVNLVGAFKEFSELSNRTDEEIVNKQSYGIGSTVALCYLERPRAVTHFKILFRSTLDVMFSSPLTQLLVLLTVPIISSLLGLFVGDLRTGSRSAPHSASGLFSIYFFILGLLTVFMTVCQYRKLCKFSYFLYSNGVCNQIIFLLAYLFVSILLTGLTSQMSASGILYFTNLFTWTDYFIFSLLTSFLALVIQGFTLTLIIFINDTFIVESVMVSCIGSLMLTAGNVRSLTDLSSSWIGQIFTFNPMQYILYIVSSTTISQLKVSNCTRNERLDIDPSLPSKFCRFVFRYNQICNCAFCGWASGLEMHAERYPESLEMPSVEMSALYLFLMLIVAYVVTILAYLVKKPLFLIKRFI